MPRHAKGSPLMDSYTQPSLIRGLIPQNTLLGAGGQLYLQFLDLFISEVRVAAFLWPLIELRAITLDR